MPNQVPQPDQNQRLNFPIAAPKPKLMIDNKAYYRNRQSKNNQQNTYNTKIKKVI